MGESNNVKICVASRRMLETGHHRMVTALFFSFSAKAFHRLKSHIYTLSAIMALFFTYGLMETQDMQDAMQAGVQKQKTIIVEKSEFQRYQWRQLEERANYMIYPIAQIATTK